MKLNRSRRLFLKASFAAGMVSSALAAGLLTPRRIIAAWNENAFDSEKVSDALEMGLGSSTASISDDIHIEVPEIAADGATVQVTVDTELPGVKSIALLSEKNPRPLCCIFRPVAGVKPKMSVRIKMGRSGDVIAVVKSEEKLYMARRHVKVTTGGCG